MDRVLFSSKSDMWETPQYLFDKLNEEFNFELDACAVASNAKCDKFYSPEDDGLSQSWWDYRTWCNPPYGRSVGLWVKKASIESQLGGLVVMLLPARVDTAWFHNFIYNKAEVRFIRGRLKFGKVKTSAPFPSMIVIFRPGGVA